MCRLSAGELGRGEVTYVKRSEDPRDSKVSFERIRSELGFEPKERLPDGFREIIAALAAREFGDPYAAHFRN
jgi:hypothetical protein